MVDRVPDGIDPLTGYRLWSVVVEGSDATFCSPVQLAATFAWKGAESGWVSASCLSLGRPSPLTNHQVPDEWCGCGFYALKQLDPDLLRFCLLNQMTNLSHGGTAEYSVMGRVDLAGKVIEHELGYRAERARIVELFPIRGSIAPVRDLARNLGLGLGPEVVPFGLDFGFEFDPPDAA